MQLNRDNGSNRSLAKSSSIPGNLRYILFVILFYAWFKLRQLGENAARNMYRFLNPVLNSPGMEFHSAFPACNSSEFVCCLVSELHFHSGDKIPE
mgnify:CR=1 FL=1